MENLDFGHGHCQNFSPFDHYNFKISAMVVVKKFLTMTMTPGPRPNGQKIVVALPPPPPKLEEQLWDNSRVRNFRGRVSYFNQSEARKHCFLIG